MGTVVMNDGVQSTSKLSLSDIKKRIQNEKYQVEVLKTPRKSNISKTVVISQAKNGTSLSRDPRCRERIKSYLENNDLLNNKHKSEAAEPNGPSSQTIFEQNKKLSTSGLGQSIQFKDTSPQKILLSLPVMKQHKQPNIIPLKQSKEETSSLLSEQNTKSSLIPNTSVKNQDIQNLSTSNKNIRDERNEINNNTMVNTNCRENKNKDFISSKQRANILTSGKYNFSAFRKNILSKYNQGLYKCPRNASNSYNTRTNRHHFYSNANNGRYFSVEKPNDNKTSIKNTVASMLNSLNTTSPRSSSSLSSTESGNLNNSKICIDLKEKRKDIKLKNGNEFNIQCNLDSKSISENKNSHISEDSDNEALLNILSQLNEFKAEHPNTEESVYKDDMTQVLKTSLPYQDPLQKMQTKDILIILNEEKKKVITLKSNEGFSQLSEKLMKCLTKDDIYESLIDNNPSLTYLTYNTKFNEWVDIDDVESFILIDGMRLKVCFGNPQNKRKKTTNNKSKKKQKVKNVEAENSILLKEDYETDQQNTSEIEETAEEQLCEELVSEKIQNTSPEKHLTVESDHDSNCEMNEFNSSMNYLQELKKFLECIKKGDDKFTENSNGNKASIRSHEISPKNKINKKFSLSEAVSEEEKEMIMKYFQFKTQHPVQKLEFVAKKMNWLLPVYNLVNEKRNEDNSTSFVYDVKINGTCVVGEAATNKKNAKKLAAEMFLKELGLSN